MVIFSSESSYKIVWNLLAKLRISSFVITNEEAHAYPGTGLFGTVEAARRQI